MFENHSEEIKKITDYWKLRKESRHYANDVTKWKNEHSGILPKSIWRENLRAGGSYSCVEVIPYDPKTGIIYLKKRLDPSATGGEKKWEGKLHIPGIVELSSMRGEDILPILLSKEILKDENKVEQVEKDLNILTQALYPEPERKTVANTLVLTLPIDPLLLTDDFSPVTPKDIDQVIEQHQLLLNAYWNKSVPPIFDSRQK
jgi:hypothetical protein